MSDEEYEVEAIVGKRVKRGIVQYRVKWRGYDVSENTWEPVSNLRNCVDLIREYERAIERLRREFLDLEAR